MAKNIFEELPARKVAPAQAAPAAAKGRDQKGGKEESGEGGSEKRIRQAVYDIRYRARREGIDLRAAYAQYMQNSNLSAPEQAAVRAKLFGKEGGGGEKKEVKEGFPNVKGTLNPWEDPKTGKSGIKYYTDPKTGKPKEGGPLGGGVFIKKAEVNKKKEMQLAHYDAMTDGATDAVATALYKVFVEKKEEEIQEDATSEKKYKVRVTDKKSGRSYVRYADRQKLSLIHI